MAVLTAQSDTQPLGGPVPLEEQKLSALTQAMVDAAKADTEAWHQFWEDGLNYLFNNQLAGKKRKKGWPPVVMNVIFPAAKQEVAILAQRKPQIEAQALKKSEEQKAKFWKGSLQYRFRKTLNMPELCRRSSWDCKTYGMAIAKVLPEDKAWWDEDKHKWMYEPRVSLIHPRAFGADPNCTRLEDAQYVYCEREVPVEWAISRWPEQKKLIIEAAERSGATQTLASAIDPPAAQADADTEVDPGLDHETKGDRSAELVSLIRRSWSPARAVKVPDELNTEDGLWQGQNVRITEVYFRDDSTVKGKHERRWAEDELEEEGALEYQAEEDSWVVRDPKARPFEGVKDLTAGSPLSAAQWPMKVEKEWDEPEFPYGRVVYKVNERVLNPKRKDQRYEYRRWPFVVRVNHMLPHLWRGVGAHALPQGSQDWINVSASHLLNYVKHHGDPVTIAEENVFPKGTEEKQFSNVAGRIWTVVKGALNKIRREPPPPMSQGVITCFDKMVRQAQDLAGMHDQAIGAAASGERTAHEVAMLQQATNVGVGLQLIQLDEWIVAIMERVAELDRKNMEPGDMLRLSGLEDEDRITEFTDELRDLEFDVTLNVGTAMPHDVERGKQDSERLMKLFPNNPEIWRYTLEKFQIQNVPAVLQAQQDYAEFLAYKEQRDAELQAQGGPPVAA